MKLEKDKILALLAEHKARFEKEFNVQDLSLFGSVARNEANSNSDLDILVKFQNQPKADDYFGLQFFLEDLFKCRVDLVTDKALRPELKSSVEKEAIHV